MFRLLISLFAVLSMTSPLAASSSELAQDARQQRLEYLRSRRSPQARKEYLEKLQQQKETPTVKPTGPLTLDQVKQELQSKTVLRDQFESLVKKMDLPAIEAFAKEQNWQPLPYPYLFDQHFKLSYIEAGQTPNPQQREENLLAVFSSEMAFKLALIYGVYTEGDIALLFPNATPEEIEEAKKSQQALSKQLQEAGINIETIWTRLIDTYHWKVTPEQRQAISQAYIKEFSLETLVSSLGSSQISVLGDDAGRKLLNEVIQYQDIKGAQKFIWLLGMEKKYTDEDIRFYLLYFKLLLPILEKKEVDQEQYKILFDALAAGENATAHEAARALNLGLTEEDIALLINKWGLIQQSGQLGMPLTIPSPSTEPESEPRKL